MKERVLSTNNSRVRVTIQIEAKCKIEAYLYRMCHVYTYILYSHLKVIVHPPIFLKWWTVTLKIGWLVDSFLNLWSFDSTLRDSFVMCMLHDIFFSSIVHAHLMTALNTLSFISIRYLLLPCVMLHISKPSSSFIKFIFQ